MSFKSIQEKQQTDSNEAARKALADQQKKLRLLIYWSFSTTVIVFAAITAYIALWVRPLGASMFEVVLSGLPIWGITGLAGAILVGGYYLVYAKGAVKAE